MKNGIKKVLLTLTLSVVSLFSFAQATNKFYNSVEDYQNKKPLDGYEIQANSWRMVMGSESFEVKENGTSDRKKLSKLPADLFTYGGSLMRRYDGHCYYVLIAGPVCYYILKNEAEVYGNGSQFFVSHIPNIDANGRDIGGTPSDYYSETITGEINKLKSKVLEKYLTQYALLESYEKDKPKREAKDSKDAYFTKEVNRVVKYLLLINEKMK